VKDDKEQTGGLVCPKCGCRHLPVYYTRRDSRTIRRTRVCRHCGYRLVTREKIIGGTRGR